MAMKNKKNPFALPISQTPETTESIVDRQDTNEMPFEFDHLPKEIAREIMLRLPAESLMQFKLVNKSSYSLITSLVNSSRFVAEHLRYHSKANTSASSFLCSPISDCVNIAANESFLSLFTLFDNQGELSYTNTELNLPPSCDDICHINLELELSPYCTEIHMYNCLKQAIHCDGIVCIIHNDFSVTLCNPALHEVKKFHLVSSPGHRAINTLIGLGFNYDQRSENYKVVVIVKNDSVVRSKAIAKVYTVGTDLWRDADISVIEPDLALNCVSLGRAVYLNGTCYWENFLDEKLVSFEMSSEVFHAAPLPDNSGNSVSNLLIRNGSLCFVCNGEESSNFILRMWLMEVECCDGARDYRYGWRECPSIRLVPEILMALAFWKEDELVVATTELKFGSYNFGTGKLQVLPIPGKSRKLRFNPYVSSLVSVKAMGK